jgi:hypothetical protein
MKLDAGRFTDQTASSVAPGEVARETYRAILLDARAYLPSG